MLPTTVNHHLVDSQWKLNISFSSSSLFAFSFCQSLHTFIFFTFLPLLPPSAASVITSELALFQLSVLVRLVLVLVSVFSSTRSPVLRPVVFRRPSCSLPTDFLTVTPLTDSTLEHT